MLITVSFPIADYRPLLHVDTYRIDMINADRFNFGDGFLRSFGSISHRYSSAEYISSDERVYAKADNGIHFCRQDEVSIGRFRVYYDCVFRRAFFGPFSARFDVGLTNRFRSTFRYEAFDIERLIKASLNLLFYANTRRVNRDISFDDKYVTAYDFGSILKKEYTYATTYRPNENLHKVSRKWLSNRVPVVVLQSDYREVGSFKGYSSRGFKKIGIPEEWNIRLYYKELRSKIPVWIVVADPEVNKERLRALRIWLLKWHQEKQTFQGVISFIGASCEDNRKNIDNSMVANCLNDLLKTIGKKKQDGFSAYEVANSIMGIERQVDISTEERFFTYLKNNPSTCFLYRRSIAAMNNSFPFKNFDPDSGKPIAFISYTSSDDKHISWVKSYAKELEKRGLTTILDQFNLPYGVHLPEFMEQAIGICDVVFVICTSEYKKKADLREGGVGYETNIITGDYYESHNDRKYITVFPYGERKKSTPLWAVGKKGIVLEDGSFDSPDFDEMIAEIIDEHTISANS